MFYNNIVKISEKLNKRNVENLPPTLQISELHFTMEQKWKYLI